jgi:CBS-domain-containing membrane protein
MGVRMVGSGDKADVWIRPVAFESVCETRGIVPPGFAEGDERLVCARFRCQKGGAERTGHDCLLCGRYRGWTDGTTPSEVRICCAWSALESVSERMTLAPAMLTVPPELPCDEADARARSAGVRHLVVTRGGELLGVVCRCQLCRCARPEQPIGALVAEHTFAIEAAATLGEAAGAMAQLGIGCLPVVDNGALVGVITRGDLRRIGVPESQLGAHQCVRCGSPHGVRPDDNGVDICLDCLDLHDAFSGAEQFGEGD